jgi:hypothetical protein
MPRAQEILDMGKEILLNCKKSETVSYDLGQTSVEMRVDKILPLFQNLLKNWDKECRKDKTDDPLKDTPGVTLAMLYNWVRFEMQGYQVSEATTQKDVLKIVKRFAPSRVKDNMIVPYPMEVLEITVNQGDRSIRLTDKAELSNTEMRRILSEVYTTIVFFVNEIVSEIDIENMPDEYGAFAQYRAPPQSITAPTAGTGKTDMSREFDWIKKNIDVGED